MLTELWKLFLSFGRATMLGYGGGPSIIPLYENEVVGRMSWMSTEDFGHALAFGNSLPGPIATKLAAYIGFKVAGWPGAIVALAAVVLPTALLMIVLVGVMNKLQNNPYIKGMIRGIQPVIFVMMAMLAYDFAKYAMKTTPGFITFIPFLLAVGYFVLVYYLNLSALYGIIGSLVIGALFLRG
ncbi:chromate transporter [Paenibacillus rhizovicinus]|uniref:Chromate transporter n=1 Tax=Paenibacillus rhizovicinus TaxID=2704463 RepID=A0A6C0P3R6_9BACL|nr:chromate transporter [Paenibacillus rhizovicinus]QHW32981.1 chromate transporter [Paenibacillus rhizovicinus]